MTRLFSLLFCALFIPALVFGSEDLSPEERLVASMADRLLLDYYYLSTCPYCKKQEPVLSRLHARTGMSIRPMSLDGMPMQYGQGNHSLKYFDGRHFAMLYGISNTPTLVAFELPNDFAILSTGFLSYDNLLQYLIAYGQQRGLISNRNLQ